MNFDRFLSDEAKLRVPSALKAFYPIMKRPGIIALSGGLPHHSTFAFDSFSASVISSSIQQQSIVISNDIDHDTASGSFDGATVKSCLQYGPGSGQQNLIKIIKDTILTESKTPRYGSWDLIITTGNTHVIDSCLRMLFNKGDGILCEQFCYSSTLETLKPMGITPIPVMMDEEGLVVSDLERAIKEFRELHPKSRIPALYVVPTGEFMCWDAYFEVLKFYNVGQNPTGSVMSVERRKELLKAASVLDFLILEDDPCNDYIYIISS